MITKLGVFLILNILLFRFVKGQVNPNHNALKMVQKKTRTNFEYETAVKELISRVIGDNQDPDNFIVRINEKFHEPELDTFQLEMDESSKKVQITANSAIAAAWGFNYYLKYFTKSSVYWSGKNINLSKEKNLPPIHKKVKITANDYFRFYQNVCTFSYSFVWWDWKRWEYEIDWMALNGINIVYAQTAAEYAWIKVFTDLGFSLDEINDFFSGPAFLAWFRMGNIKSYGGYLPNYWHKDQVQLLKLQLKRYDALGIKYILPAFSGFVPDNITRLYPDKNFTVAADWIGFGCNYSCVMMINPMDSLFKRIGQAYLKEVIQNFGTAHFYSADVFNEMVPKSNNTQYLANINAAIYDSITEIDKEANLVMQAWLFYSASSFWTLEATEAFLSKIPIGHLILLDLFSESVPQYTRYKSFFGHYFIWNMLHDYGGANGMFGPLPAVNLGPEKARNFVNSSMVGIGITMEGINQNELIYEFILEKSWRNTLNSSELNNWINEFTDRRYRRLENPIINVEFHKAWQSIVRVIYNTEDFQRKQMFTKRPSFLLTMNPINDVEVFFTAWDTLINVSYSYQSSDLFKYDLIDLSKEVLTIMFEQSYASMVQAWHKSDLYTFSKKSTYLIDMLVDIEKLLASDSRFLLGKWLNDAKLKGTNFEEREMYEWNARLQVTLWGINTTQQIFDYACKAWSGLVEDYYIPRWKIFFNLAERALIEGVNIDTNELNSKLMIEAELPFVSSRKVYPTTENGNSFKIAQEIFMKYRM